MIMIIIIIFIIIVIRRRWEDDTKMNHKEMEFEGVDWVDRYWTFIPLKNTVNMLVN
jgi:hypothetical protein